jgi:hypothetical protein
VTGKRHGARTVTGGAALSKRQQGGERATDEQGQEIRHAGGLAPLWALSMVAQTAGHSTFGVVLILAGSGVILALASMCGQGYRFSRHKNCGSGAYR